MFGLGKTPGAVLARYQSVRARLTPQAPVDNAMLLDLALAGAMYASESFIDAAMLLVDLETFLDAQRTGDAVTAAAARARITARPLPTGVAGAAPDAGRWPRTRPTPRSSRSRATTRPGSAGGHSSSPGPSDQGDRFPLLGSGTLNEPCAFWRVATPHLVPPSGAGMPPVLVVQSAHDPATPLEGARRTVAALPGARMLMVTGEGDHGLYAGGNACVDAAVERWITAGRLPAVGTTCRGKGLPDPVTAGLPVRPSAARAAALSTPPGNPLTGLQRVRAAVRDRLTCRSGAAGGC